MLKITSLLLFTPYTLFANSYLELLKEEEPSLWVSLFALAVVSIISLFLSSEKLKEVDKRYKSILEKEKEIEEKQQNILEFMSAKIETSTKGIIKQRQILEQNVSHTINPFSLKSEIIKFQESESLLLDATHELIDFLKIKSGRLEISNDPYKIVNVLDQVTSSVNEIFKRKKTELVYDVSQDVPSVLVGDSRRIEQIITTLLNDTIASTYEGTVLLRIMLLKNKKIVFDIYNPKKVMLNDEIKSLLENYVLKEEYKSEEKLFIYVVNQIIKLMKGNLVVTSSVKDGTHYTVELPYKASVYDVEPFEVYSSLTVSLATENKQLLDVLTERLSHSNVVVDDWDESKEKLHDCDMLMIDASRLSPNVLRAVDEIQKQTALYVIVLKNSYDSLDKNTLFLHKILHKPLSNQTIFESLKYVERNKTNSLPKENVEEGIKSTNINLELKDRKNITRESFKQFSHLHILIVDDNRMNQKILEGVFSNSGMMISMVNNGEEAVAEVKNNSELDIIFMDTNMPVMDGYEATRTIRESRTMKVLPIIGMASAVANSSVIEKQGFNAFLHKPFKIGQLYTALNMYTSPNKSTIKYVYNKLKKYEMNKDILDINIGISQAN